jgi:hypothetical protein
MSCEQEPARFCSACFTGTYPVPVDPAATKLSLETITRGSGTGAGR